MTKTTVAKRICVPFQGIFVHPTIKSRVERLAQGHPDYRFTSGWRSEKQNERVGGHPRSRHLAGVAVDVVVGAEGKPHLLQSARHLGATEIIDEGDHVHLAWPRPPA